MERPPYISYSTFESLAVQTRQELNTWSKSQSIAIPPIDYLEFLVEEKDLAGWCFKNLNKHLHTSAWAKQGADTTTCILGMYDVRENVIWIEESLQEYPARLAFTIAHEGEHFTKHRGLFASELQNYSMFFGQHTFICNREDIGGKPSGDVRRKQMEWQANHGAACLLMPLLEINHDINSGASVYEIAEKYGVSYQAASIRIKQIRSAIQQKTKEEYGIEIW